MLPVKIISQKASKLHAEALVAGFFQDDRPLTGLSAEIDLIHNGIISHLILRGKIHGDLKETTLLATQRKLHANKILLVGLGKKDQLTPKTLQTVYSHIDHILSQLHVKDYAVELFGPTGPTAAEVKVVEAVLAGLREGPARSIEMTLLVSDEERAERIRQHLQVSAGDA